MTSLQARKLKKLYNNIYTLNCKNGLWLKSERIQIPIISRIGMSSYVTYVYMCSWVITDVNTKRGIWRQIAKEFFINKRLLPFCKNEINIASDLAISKTQVQRNITNLIEAKLIKYETSVLLSKHNRKKAKVYTVGSWSESKPDKFGDRKRIFDFSLYLLAEEENKSEVNKKYTSNQLD